MDGLLINTEDLYTEAINQLLADYHKDLTLPWSIKIKLQGLPGPEASRAFLEWSKLPITPEQYYTEMTKRLEALLHKAQFLPGAQQLLIYLATNNIPMALATSSRKKMMELKTKHLQKDGFSLFGSHVVTGDDPRIKPGRGKPLPDIWFVALESLNSALEQEHAASTSASAPFQKIKPEECLVFEDGQPGVISAKAMGATVIWVPHEGAVQAMGKENANQLIQGSGKMIYSLADFDPKEYF